MTKGFCNAWVILFPWFDRGNAPTIPLTLITLFDAEKREERPLEPSVTPCLKKLARVTDIYGSKTSFLVDKVKEGLKIECGCNFTMFV